MSRNCEFDRTPADLRECGIHTCYMCHLCIPRKLRPNCPYMLQVMKVQALKRELSALRKTRK